MKIKQLKLKTNHLKEMKVFYSEVLQMSLIEETARAFSVAAGDTIICYEQHDEYVFYHYAFFVDVLNFNDVLETVIRNSPLLKDGDGQIEFYSELWQRKQLYFKDPQGNILEILPTDERSSTDNGWVRVQEMGIPVDHIYEMRSQINDIKDKFSLTSDLISFYGDQYGVFVLVKEGRAWFPTEEAAISAPAEILIVNDCEMELEHGAVKIKAVSL